MAVEADQSELRISNQGPAECRNVIGCRECEMTYSIWYTVTLLQHCNAPESDWFDAIQIYIIKSIGDWLIYKKTVITWFIPIHSFIHLLIDRLESMVSEVIESYLWVERQNWGFAQSRYTRLVPHQFHPPHQLCQPSIICKLQSVSPSVAFCRHREHIIRETPAPYFG